MRLVLKVEKEGDMKFVYNIEDKGVIYMYDVEERSELVINEK